MAGSPTGMPPKPDERGHPDLIWSPYCGATCRLIKLSGELTTCDRNEHGPDTQHCDSETGFRWW